MAHFKRVKISFSTENPRKTIKNVIFFTWLESGIITSNCYIFIQKPLFQIFGGVVLLCLHNADYPQTADSKGFRAYFLAVCEIRAVYNKTGSEKPVISAFLFLTISRIPEISQSPCVPFLRLLPVYNN